VGQVGNISRNSRWFVHSGSRVYSRQSEVAKIYRCFPTCLAPLAQREMSLSMKKRSSRAYLECLVAGKKARWSELEGWTAMEV
jgi:hypothetical protein